MERRDWNGEEASDDDLSKMRREPIISLARAILQMNLISID